MQRQGIRDYFANFSHYNRRDWPRILLGVLLAIVANVCGLVTPLLTRFIIDDVIGKGRGNLFGTILLVSAAVTITLFASSMLSNMIMFKVFRYNGLRFRTDIFKAIQGAPLAFFNKISPGELNYRLMSDARVLIESWSGYLVALPYQAILLASALFMYRWNPKLAVFVFILVVLQGFLIWRFRDPLKRFSHARKRMEQDVSGFATDRLANISLMRSLGIEETERGSLAQRLGDLIKQTYREFIFNHFSSISMSVVSMVWQFGILWYGGRQVISGEMTLGTLMAFVMFANMLYQPIVSIMSMLLSFQTVVASLERLREVLDLEQVTESRSGDRILPAGELAVQIENLTFGYNDKPVLRDINLELKPNTITTLVGPSGVGKSTLALLLSRMMNGFEGRILVGGVPSDEIDYSNYRDSVQLLCQGHYIMSGSILENITMGIDSPSDEKIMDVISRFNMEYIYDLPDGLETRIGAGGLTLSSGEAQRVGLVRAFLSSPRLLIMDEPTSNIDLRTEGDVHQAINEFRRNCTVLIVAHSVATMKIADKVALVENGRILHEGTFDEMLRIDSFRELINELED